MSTSTRSPVPFLGVRHAALATADLAAALEFYQTYLGFEPYHVGDRDWAMLVSGDTSLSLVQVDGYRAPERVKGENYAHVGVVVATREAVDEVHARLVGAGATVSRVKGHRDGSYGFYFHDRDGNDLECIFIPQRSHAAPARNEGWIVLAHGSSDPKWARPFERLMERLKAHVPKQDCRLAFMERATAGRGFEECVVGLVEGKGVQKVKVFPVFLSAGGVHMQRDVPAMVESARAKFPKVEFLLEAALGEHLLVEEAIAAAIVRLAD